MHIPFLVGLGLQTCVIRLYSRLIDRALEFQIQIYGFSSWVVHFGVAVSLLVSLNVSRNTLDPIIVKKNDPIV